MDENAATYGIETRSRSRSKTPSRIEAPPVRGKTPNVQTILEESETTTSMTSMASSSVSTTSVRTSKRMKEPRIVLTSVSETVVTSTPTASAEKKVLKKKTSAGESKLAKKNLLLESSIEPIKSITSPNGKSDNAAYQQYKEAGEYWNTTPKTDYTYSELSPHRREIAPNTIAMPNMSRKSLDKHHTRVNAMISRSPEQATYIRQRYAATSRFAANDYDSGDERDYEFMKKQTKNQSNFNLRYQQETVTRRMRRVITTFITYIFTSVTSVFSSNRTESLYYTQINRPSVFQRFCQGIVNCWLAIMKVCYITISTVTTLDTWLLMSRVQRTQGERKRRFLLLMLLLLPLLLTAGYFYHDKINVQAITVFMQDSKDKIFAAIGNLPDTIVKSVKKSFKDLCNFCTVMYLYLTSHVLNPFWRQLSESVPNFCEISIEYIKGIYAHISSAYITVYLYGKSLWAIFSQGIRTFSEVFFEFGAQTMHNVKEYISVK